jgi:uncharacterized damage-inducible protein DinB
MDDAVALRFTAVTVWRLREVYLPRLATAVRSLPEADLWWSPHEGTNSVGQLLRHLEGNVRQYILSGIGKEPDRRARSEEFHGAHAGTRDEVHARLEATVRAACDVIETLDARALLSTHVFQGERMDALSAVYHVLEHFGWHLGQIVWLVKLRGGPAHGIRFHDDEALNRGRNA